MRNYVVAKSACLTALSWFEHFRTEDAFYASEPSKPPNALESPFLSTPPRPSTWTSKPSTAIAALRRPFDVFIGLPTLYQFANFFTGTVAFVLPKNTLQLIRSEILRHRPSIRIRSVACVASRLSICCPHLHLLVLLLPRLEPTMFPSVLERTHPHISQSERQ